MEDDYKSGYASAMEDNKALRIKLNDSETELKEWRIVAEHWELEAQSFQSHLSSAHARIDELQGQLDDRTKWYRLRNRQTALECATKIAAEKQAGRKVTTIAGEFLGWLEQADG